jgi:hypothetical protein
MASTAVLYENIKAAIMLIRQDLPEASISVIQEIVGNVVRVMEPGRWPVEPDKAAAVQAIIKKFDERKPLPHMSQMATAALALNHCLDVIDAVREAVK